ncbi:hypothetical protein NQ317_004384 [Molorchus minor]|uniref:Dynein heavy chain C-terminal domain-containing protein n=1 Tax=Molorchus minor TaxID=1323400 RepID=A0ABQ9J7Y1_9CUCU|nr:hypothetical protein NQ317_004384 [Molorchus minor]
MENIKYHSGTKFKATIFRKEFMFMVCSWMVLDGIKKQARLSESINKVLYTMLPVVHVYAIYATTPSLATLYVCPVYKKKRRTGLNYITVLYLQTARPPAHWTLRGVALLCDVQ